MERISKSRPGSGLGLRQFQYERLYNPFNCPLPPRQRFAAHESGYGAQRNQGTAIGVYDFRSIFLCCFTIVVHGAGSKGTWARRTSWSLGLPFCDTRQSGPDSSICLLLIIVCIVEDRKVPGRGEQADPICPLFVMVYRLGHKWTFYSLQ